MLDQLDRDPMWRIHQLDKGQVATLYTYKYEAGPPGFSVNRISSASTTNSIYLSAARNRCNKLHFEALKQAARPLKHKVVTHAGDPWEGNNSIFKADPYVHYTIMATFCEEGLEHLLAISNILL
jgi:hypothetical protein